MVYALPPRKGGRYRAIELHSTNGDVTAIDDKRYRREISDFPSADRTATD
jgi:hypothetical protein